MQRNKHIVKFKFVASSSMNKNKRTEESDDTRYVAANHKEENCFEKKTHTYIRKDQVKDSDQNDRQNALDETDKHL